MAKATLLDIAKLNGNDAVVGLIEESIQFSPEAAAVPFRTISGTEYKTGIRTALPDAGFRQANNGFIPSKSKFKNKLVQAYIFGGRIEADKAVADAYEDGAEAWQAIEASGMMESAMRDFGKQFYYGTSEDANGFPGLDSVTPFGDSTTSGDDLTVDAGGTTAGEASSVYAVRFGERYTQGIVGREGAFDLPEFRIETITGENGNPLDGYVSTLTSWIGLQTVNENAARRILNLTDDSGKGLTDALLADLLDTFPVGVVPDVIMINRRSRKQLQKSRQVVLQGSGRTRPNQPAIAPLPEEYDGIPLVVTDSITNDNAIES